MKYLKTYEGYGGRNRTSQMDCDEIQTIDDIPEGYSTSHYENRELTTHEKELVNQIFGKYTSVLIPKDVIMDRLYDIKDITPGINIEIKDSIYCNGEFIYLDNIDQFDLHDLISSYSKLDTFKAWGESYTITNIDIEFPLSAEKLLNDDNEGTDMADEEGFKKASDMLNDVKEFFESYTKCEVETEVLRTTMGLLIRYETPKEL